MNETNLIRNVKKNGYKNNILHANRKQKRLEAQSRNDKYNSLSIQDKIKLVTSRRGNSAKELKRLNDLLNKQPLQPVQSTTVKETKKETKSKPAIRKSLVKKTSSRKVVKRDNK